jgi:E3 ubiquitin-protein ligase RNF139
MPTYANGIGRTSAPNELLYKFASNPINLVELYDSLSYHTIQLMSIGLFTFCRSQSHKTQTSALLIAHLCTHYLALFLPDHMAPTVTGVLTYLLKQTLLLAPTIVGFAFLIGDACRDLKKALPLILDDLHWCRAVLRYHGLFALSESQWNRLRLPTVLQAFWISKAFLLFNVWLHSTFPNEEPQVLWTVIVKRLLLSNCETLISLLGTSAVVCFVCDSVEHVVMRWLIQAPEESDEKSAGPISAVLFFVLALQTGLTEINGELRFIRLYQNLCLLLTANLHLLHNTLSQVLFWLSASRNNSLGRHIRALVACAFLALASILLAVLLVRTHSFGSWLLAVIAFCVEMVIKVILTLIVYALFMLDAHRLSLWESLDDYVFYVRSLSSSVEFLFAILIFLNGVWILVYESGGRIRAFMVGVHLYFNIWLQAIAGKFCLFFAILTLRKRHLLKKKNIHLYRFIVLPQTTGIRVILKRRKAAKKLSLLLDASLAQLKDFDDVCAICYQDLSSAKITACRHYFHAVCLRKWLNIRDTCPICQEVIFPPEAPPSNAQAEPATSEPLAQNQNTEENPQND